MRQKKEKAKSTRRGRFNVRTRVGAICLLSTTFLIPISPVAGGMAEGLTAYRAGDYVTAHAEWLPLAREGAAAAQRNVGQLYRLGQGVPRDAAVAANWYRLAAEQGLARAQSNLAAMYLQGDGVEKNTGVAAAWLRRAAAQGHTSSQFNLGLMYETGVGLGIDLVKARSWYELAAGAGNAKARERLAGLRNAPAEDDVALLPPARRTAASNSSGTKSSMPEIGTRGLIMPPADPDVAREAKLTKVRIAIAQVLRERAALATRQGKTDLPPPPFARADAGAEIKPADVALAQTVPTETAQAEATAITTPEKPLPEFLRREAASDTGVPQFRPLPSFLVAEAQRDEPVPEFLRQEAKNDTGRLAFKPLPPFLAEEARQEARGISVAAASPAPPTATPLGSERDVSPPASDVSEHQPKPRPAFLRQTATGNGGALKFKPLPQFLADEAQQGDREITVAAVSPAPPPVAAPAVEQKTLSPLPRRPQLKPIPEFLKREAKAPVPLVAPAVRSPARKPPPAAPQIAALDSLSVPLPSFLRGEIREDRTQQLALNAEPGLGPDLGPDTELHLYAPQAEKAEDAPDPDASPAPNFLMFEAARNRATELAAESLALMNASLASQSLTSQALTSQALTSETPPPEFLENEAKADRAARFALGENRQPLVSVLQVPEDATVRTIDVKPIPDFLIREAKETRRSLVVDLARSLRAVLRPARHARVADVGSPTAAKPVPEFLKREATEDRRQTVAALADGRTGRHVPAALIADARSPAQARSDDVSQKPIPEFLRREVREQHQVASAAEPTPEFLKVEALLDGAAFGAFKPLPEFIRKEAAGQALVLASAGAKPVPDFIQREAKLGFGAHTFALRRESKRATIIRASLVNVGLVNAEPAKSKLGALPVPAYIKLEAALEARFINASPPPPIRVRAVVPSKLEERTQRPDRDQRPNEPRSAVVLKAAVRESDEGPLWLGEPERRQALSGRVVEAGLSAYRENDFNRAYELWLAVARRGNADAQFLVGGLYADGTGVAHSLGRAYQWWRLSGDQGHTRAQELLPTLLGLMDEEESDMAGGTAQTT